MRLGRHSISLESPEFQHDQNRFFGYWWIGGPLFGEARRIMKRVDYLIIGGSAAGTTAAEVIRGLLPDSIIKIITDENHEQYSRVLIPHYVRHKVTREQIFLKRPQWYGDKKIELVKGVGAEKLDWKNHLVGVSNGDEYQYGKLLIAVGGKVIPFDAPGANLENILYMRTIEDADKIIEVSRQSQRGVIVGGGFIGLEFTSCFKKNGVGDVTVLVKEPYFWQGKLDEASSKVLVSTLEANGVRVVVDEEVNGFEGSEKVLAVTTKSGKRYDAEVVGVGIGIKSDLEWLKDSGIKIGRAILTNEYLETNLPDVFAAGDCAEFYDVVFERQHVMGNWANGTSQGNTVGKNMAATSLGGPKVDFEGQGRAVFETASSYSINFFDPPAGGFCSFIGVTEDKFADEVVSRGSVEEGRLTRIFIKTINKVMRVVGATIINNPAEVGPLSTALRGRVDILSYKEKLPDQSFNLVGLV